MLTKNSTLCKNVTYPTNEIKALENHVGVKRGATFRSLSCSPIRDVL